MLLPCGTTIRPTNPAGTANWPLADQAKCSSAQFDTAPMRELRSEGFRAQRRLVFESASFLIRYSTQYQ